MAPASVAVSLSFRVVPPRPCRRRARWPRPIRASSDGSGVANGDRKVGALEGRVGDLRAVVASVPPAVAAVRASSVVSISVHSNYGLVSVSVRMSW